MSWDNQKPDVIEVHFEYENHVKTPYHVLELEDHSIERVSIDGIHRFFDECEEDELSLCSVSYWEPSQYGWDAKWRMTGEEFMSVAKLVEIKVRPTQ